MGELVVSGGGGMEADVAVRTEGDDIRREIDDKDSSTEVVRWEKFLPRMVLTVLLVEADDSTRQIIAALLRKCSYKVAAVPDGLMAWETLKARPHDIDLILTEVELPSISGYALLTLVMEHDICKNIPVIMMSSHDSISMVLKCMLKGAADFLIKPVRRNELRNLWKHVWTRQNLTAGRIPQDSPYTQHKIEAGSENNSASDYSSECATSSLKRKQLSDEGSDVQVLPHMECRNAANTDNAEKKKYREYAALDEKTIIPDRKTIDGSTRLESECPSLNEDRNSTDPELGDEYMCSKVRIHDEDVKAEDVRINVNSSDSRKFELIEPSNGAIDLIGTFDGQKRTHGHLQRHDGTDKFEITPELELSLTRCFPNDPKNPGVEGRDALNHSSASPFSRYNSKTLQPLFPTSTSKCTEFKENVTDPPGPSSNAAGQNVKCNSQTNAENLNGNQETETNLVIGQSAEAELAYQNSQKPVSSSGVRLDNACNGHIHPCPPVCHSNTVGQQGQSPKMASQQEHCPYPGTTSTHEICDHENTGQLDATAMNSVGQSMHQPSNVEDVGQLRQSSSASGYSRSSSMSNSAADHNSSSAYKSFTSGSDGNASFAVTSEKASLNDGGHLFVRDGFRVADAHYPSHREAALTKFLMKRKERCFEKKVRYQSRKKLAEQRPRVKGQFVRQVPNDASIGGAN